MINMFNPMYGVFRMFQPITLSWIQFAVAGLSAFTAASSASAANRAAAREEENIIRRYELQADIAKSQIEEQRQIARDKMTEVSLKFLAIRGKEAVTQAETMVGGKLAKRKAFMARAKESEVKSKVAKEVDTNVVNIAQDMVAKKIDADAMIAEARSKKQNVFTATVIGGLQGYMAGTQFAATDLGKSMNTMFTPSNTYANIDTSNLYTGE